ncbi:MAG: helix-turn-helix transcriptional regulator [Rickettsia sp.]|nr:helix-turn-helix transcriptional regulator [Rickettsia sp.]
MQNIKELPKGRVDNIDRLVSKRLRMRRVMLGLSQYDISRAIDVSVQQVQKYEKAINRISSGKLHILARFLKVPIEYFFEKINADITGNAFSFLQEEKSEKVDISDTVPEKEIFSLVKAFSDIKDQNRRKKILELTKVLG